MRFQPLQALACGTALATTLLIGGCALKQQDAPDNQPSQPFQTLPSVKAAKDEAEAETRSSADKTALESAIVTGSYVPSAPQNAALPVEVIELQSLRTQERQRKPSAQAHTAEIAPAPPPYRQSTNTEQYDHLDENPIRVVAEQPVSTFSIDVDTGAYANVRRFLNAAQLPPQDAVRVEEMINYFDYGYAPPASRDTPFKVNTEIAPAPWNPDHLLLRVGVKGYEVAASERPAANLVFLIDVSGSMSSPDKLPLLRNAFKLLTQQMSNRDRISIVVYAGSTGVVLEPTPGNEHSKILAAIDRLQAGGSTNGAAGITLAYRLAREAFIDKGINRVVLATDGDFNVGTVNFEALVDIVERERGTGVELTTLGFGGGNYNEQLM
ncbi:MAG TPA: von Willebrand factor type A domain-containing protein, partial [Steroidobacteraceae bacterium]|nr:von Willebrand factor type A domain-containing protein [Steroidobacteraceae bacterium]